MGKTTKIVLIVMLGFAIAILLFVAYEMTAFYRYKSFVLDKFPVEPAVQEDKRFFEVERERKERAIELAKQYARKKSESYGESQNIADKVKGDLKIIGWEAEKAIHVGLLYDAEGHGVGLLEEFKASMERIQRGLLRLKNLGFLAEGSPASELLLESEPKYFAARIKKLKEEYVSIQFYLLPRGKGMVKAKDLSTEAKKVVDEIDREIEKTSGLMKYFYHYADSLYLVSFRYQTEQDRIHQKTQGWYFEVDLDSGVVRDVGLEKEMSKKYPIASQMR